MSDLWQLKQLLARPIFSFLLVASLVAMWTTQAMHDEERLVDVENGLETARQSITDLRAEVAVLRADIANLSTVVAWMQRLYNWMAAAARNFPWH